MHIDCVIRNFIYEVNVFTKIRLRETYWVSSSGDEADYSEKRESRLRFREPTEADGTSLARDISVGSSSLDLRMVILVEFYFTRWDIHGGFNLGGEFSVGAYRERQY